MCVQWTYPEVSILRPLLFSCWQNPFFTNPAVFSFRLLVDHAAFHHERHVFDGADICGGVTVYSNDVGIGITFFRRVRNGRPYVGCVV
jgi:hypothetical protein